MAIVVTSTIIKKVRLEHNLILFKLPYIKYRYFFDIHNNSTTVFDGSVTIGLYRSRVRGLLDLSLQQLGIKVVKAIDPIEPGQHKIVWMDLYSGPVHIHGKYGVTHFDWVTQVEGHRTINGQEAITSKYEDLA
jgi:hypothetical protein